MSIKSDVYKMICELHEAGRMPRREVIWAEMQKESPHMTQGSVDGAIKDLFNVDMLIDRVERGTYVPKAPRQADRAISVSPVPAGPVKCEVGDLVLDLTWSEARLFGALLFGLYAGFGR